jgi:hypothetical protein
MRRKAAVAGNWAACLGLAAVLWCGACTSASVAPRHSTPGSTAATPAGAAGRRVMPGGCGATPVLAGTPPAWNPRPAGFSGEPFLPYVLGRADVVMGYLFGHPLYAPESTVRSNKILWYVRYPRDGYELQLTGQLRTGPGRTVSEAFPDNASPGEIYPSDVTVPVPGCWSFTVTWGSHTDHVDLAFTAPPR